MDNNQTAIARYIWYILTLNTYIPMSWGIETESMVASEDSLEFKVNGFIHSGSVRVSYIEGADLFQICLYKDGTLVSTTNDVYVDQLTDTIDRLVENTGEDYDSRVIASLTQTAS